MNKIVAVDPEPPDTPNAQTSGVRETEFNRCRQQCLRHRGPKNMDAIGVGAGCDLAEKVQDPRSRGNGGGGVPHWPSKSASAGPGVHRGKNIRGSGGPGVYKGRKRRERYGQCARRGRTCRGGTR